MPDISIMVNGRAYRVTCGDGEEERLTALAAEVDHRVNHLARQIGQANESQMLLLTALLLTDELYDSREQLAHAQMMSRHIPLPAPPPPPPPRYDPNEMPPEVALAIAERIESLAQRIETLATRWERA